MTWEFKTSLWLIQYTCNRKINVTKNWQIQEEQKTLFYSFKIVGFNHDSCETEANHHAIFSSLILLKSGRVCQIEADVYGKLYYPEIDETLLTVTLPLFLSYFI